MVGLDGFQQINDMLGHACGDLVLCAVTERLNAEAGSAAIVARLSGDEFAIAIPCADTAETVAQLSERIALAFDARFWPERGSIASGSVSERPSILPAAEPPTNCWPTAISRFAAPRQPGAAVT